MKTGDDKMNVNLVDDYSNEDFVVIHTDKGEFLCGKCGGGFLKKNEHGEWAEMGREESADLVDNWIGYREQNRDELSDTLEDLEYHRNKTNKDNDHIIYALKNKG
jgi:hypothetical protein